MAVGFILQRSRFCLAAAYRDFILFDDRSIARAVLILLMLSSLGFAWLQQQPPAQPAAASCGTDLAADPALPPGNLSHVTWATALGGLLFGLGMVLSGSCISGSLWRLGEGYLVQVWTLLGLTVGAGMGYLWHRSGWDPTGRVLHLAMALGWPWALGLQMFLLGLLLAWLWWTDPLREPVLWLRRPETGIAKPGPASWSSWPAWPAWLGATLLAVLGVGYFAWRGSPWGVLTPFVHWPELTAGAGSVREVTTDGLMVNLGLVVGAGSAAFAFREFKLRRPRSRLQSQLALVGGITMGLGAAIAHGCTWGALVNGISSFSLHGWTFAVSLIPGAWLGARWLRKNAQRL